MGFKSPWKQLSTHVCVGYRLMRLAEMLRLTLCMVGTISTSWGRSEWVRCELSISIQYPLLPSCACDVTSYFTLLPPCLPHQGGLCPFRLPAEISLSQCFLSWQQESFCLDATFLFPCMLSIFSWDWYTCRWCLSFCRPFLLAVSLLSSFLVWCHPYRKLLHFVCLCFLNLIIKKKKQIKTPISPKPTYSSILKYFQVPSD